MQLRRARLRHWQPYLGCMKSAKRSGQAWREENGGFVLELAGCHGGIQGCSCCERSSSVNCSSWKRGGTRNVTLLCRHLKGRMCNSVNFRATPTAARKMLQSCLVKLGGLGGTHRHAYSCCGEWSANHSNCDARCCWVDASRRSKETW